MEERYIQRNKEIELLTGRLQMNIRIRRICYGFLGLFVAIGMVLLGGVKIKATTVERELKESDFKIEIGPNTIDRGQEVPLTTETSSIRIRLETGFSSDFEVDWTVGSESVIKVTKDEESGQYATITRKGPGFSSITARITTGNGTKFTMTCNIRVDLVVDKSSTIFRDATTTEERILVFEKLVVNGAFPQPVNPDDQATGTVDHSNPKQNSDKAKTIPLKYTNGGTVEDNSTMEWVSSNTNVVTVNEDGRVTPVGAGHAIISISTRTSSASGQKMETSVEVVVSPFGSEPKQAEADPYRYDRKITHVARSADFYIETNAKNASKLIWDVRDSNNNLINPTGNPLLNYAIDDLSGKIYIYNAKAGVYKITAKTNDKFGGIIWNIFEAEVIVPVFVNTAPVYMNVHDTYNILENSNLPRLNLYDYEVSDHSILELDAAKGIVKALSTGNATITLTPKATGLYTAQQIAAIKAATGIDLAEKIILSFVVIDGISISPNSAVIYVGGTLVLTYNTSAPQEATKWASSDPKIATVTDGTVTGIKPGEVVITVTQVINGITKSANCKITVRETITGITIEPKEAIINVKETLTLSAKVTPSSMGNLPLKWVSTNEDIVKITRQDGQNATIEGVAGGKAVILAVNPQNIVIGTCEVTVKRKVQSIILNETELTVLLNQRNIQLRATVLPADANNKKIIWTSTNPKVATVNAETGMVTLVGHGTVSIIATSDDDPKVTAICNITIGVPVSGLTLDETKRTMAVGEASRIGHVITPTNATNKAITWSSTDTSIVTVDGTGLVTARKEGIAIIMAKTVDGNIIRTCTVTVMEKGTGVKLDVKDVEISVGQIYQIPFSIIPATAKDIKITWESSDTKVVTVDGDGKLTGVSSGKAVVMAKPSVGTAMMLNVTVVQHANDMKLNFEQKTITIGEKFKLRATLIPSDSTLKNVNWTSSRPDIARVTAAGNVTGIKGGTAIITGKTEDGKLTAFCVVNVVEKVTTIKLNTTNYRLGLNKTYTLKATVKSNAATNPKVTWESSNPSIVTVDSKGKITGRKLGTATITAKANDGSNVEATATIRVVRLVTSISLNKSTVTTVVGRTFALKATVKPSNATYKTAKWTSSDESIAIVDSKGNVTALKEGNVRITATANDSSNKSASAYVIVQPRVPASSVTIINQNLTMVVGETTTLQKAINPIASNDRVTWETDNKTVATVNKSTGKITAKNPGIASVTVMTESGRTATTKVTVVGLNTTKLNLEQYSSYTLSVIGINSGVSWDISDSRIAEVRNGRIETRGVGTTTITATVNGRKLYCTLTVTKIR